jgi:hypothetical protein
MVKTYYGGVISATAPTVSEVAASGFFNPTQQMHAKTSGVWPQSVTPSAIFADATYNAQGWVSASTDYVGLNGNFSFNYGAIQNASGGARTNLLPYTTTSKIYFEVHITSGGGSEGNALFGLAGDASTGGYNSVPSVYVYNGGGYGGYSVALNAGLANGDKLMVAYNAITGKVFYGRNGTWSIDPVSGTGATIPNVTAGSLAPRLIIMSGATLGSTVGGTFKSNSLTYSAPSGYSIIN